MMIKQALEKKDLPAASGGGGCCGGET